MIDELEISSEDTTIRIQKHRPRARRRRGGAAARHAGGAGAGCRRPRRDRAGRRSRAGQVEGDPLAHRGHLLPRAFARVAHLRQRRRPRVAGADPVHHRGHEGHERDRGRVRRRDQGDPGRERQPGRGRGGALPGRTFLTAATTPRDALPARGALSPFRRGSGACHLTRSGGTMIATVRKGVDLASGRN